MTRLEADHIFIFHEKQLKFKENANEVLLENNEWSWNHAEVFIDTYFTWELTLIDMQIGIHVFKGKNSMENIRFTNAYKRDHNNVNWDLNSMVSTSTSIYRQKKALAISKVNRHFFLCVLSLFLILAAQYILLFYLIGRNEKEYQD